MLTYNDVETIMFWIIIYIINPMIVNVLSRYILAKYFNI